MYLVLQLGREIIDAVLLLEEQEKDRKVVLLLIDELLKRNADIIKLYHEQPEFYIEKTLRIKNAFFNHIHKANVPSFN